ncbi:MAG: DUF2764 family protein, partial [Candidatus Cloacimonadaceae bacterium]
MYKEYYYFVTGLPALNPEDTKLLQTPLMFLHDAEDHLEKQDYDMLKLLFIPNEITNLISLLLGKETWLDESTITKEDCTELLQYLKQLGDARPAAKVLKKYNIPQYLIDYVHQYLLANEPK